MGYRSEINILITLPENVSARKVINKFKKAWGEDFNEYFSTDDECVENCLYIGTKEDLKWYEGSFEAVTNFMELVRNWEDYYKTGGIHFIRLGENYDDIEEICSGDVMNMKYLGLSRTTTLP